MRLLALALMAALSLTGCAGYHGPQGPEYASTADIPTETNDGFYDGGVFTQDLGPNLR